MDEIKGTRAATDRGRVLEHQPYGARLEPLREASTQPP